jgi:hypothetical protein
VQWPVSWLRTVIPGMKREQARAGPSPTTYRNGSTPAAPDSPNGQEPAILRAKVFTGTEDIETLFGPAPAPARKGLPP